MRKADKNWNYFELSTAERKTAHKYLKKQANGIISKPIHKLTLNRYFEIVREAMLALCDNNGLFRNWYETSTQINYKELSPKEAAKICMGSHYFTLIMALHPLPFAAIFIFANLACLLFGITMKMMYATSPSDIL